MTYKSDAGKPNTYSRLVLKYIRHSTCGRLLLHIVDAPVNKSSSVFASLTKVKYYQSTLMYLYINFPHGKAGTVLAPEGFKSSHWRERYFGKQETFQGC
jgi:hypothetical protein